MSNSNGKDGAATRPPFLEYRAAGLSCIPIKGDASKAPAVSSWKKYSKQIATEAECKRWGEKAPGIAIIGGAVSGNLEILDIDEPEIASSFIAAIKLQDPDLLPKLCRIRTPRRNWRDREGGHLIYRSETPVAVISSSQCQRPRQRSTRMENRSSTPQPGSRTRSPTYCSKPAAKAVTP